MKRIVGAVIIAASFYTPDVLALRSLLSDSHAYSMINDNRCDLDADIMINTTQTQKILSNSYASSPKPLSLARLKYQGGGDWYSSRTALSNLAKFSNQQLHTELSTNETVVEAGSADLFRFPFIFMTGHGNVVFSDAEASNLRNYLISGGFLHICDNFGMDPFIKREIKKVFPELSFQVVPFTHPIYHGAFQFPNGLPKVHEHEGKPPVGYGLFWEGKLVCFYDYECDLGNGWEDPEVYKDPQQTREQALRMGANLIQYAFTQK